MLSKIAKYISIVSLLSFATYPQEAFADARNSGEFFKDWSEQSQIALVSSSMVMALVIASQSDKKLYECLQDWYSKTQEQAEQRNRQIAELALKNPSVLPQIAILAVIEKKCGRFPAR